MVGPGRGCAIVSARAAAPRRSPRSAWRWPRRRRSADRTRRPSSARALDRAGPGAPRGAAAVELPSHPSLPRLQSSGSAALRSGSLTQIGVPSNPRQADVRRSQEVRHGQRMASSLPRLRRGARVLLRDAEHRPAKRGHLPLRIAHRDELRRHRPGAE